MIAESEVYERYIDADDRPWDHSHDGNGWREKVRAYTLGPAVTDPATLSALHDAWDLRHVRANFVAGYLDALSPAERASRELAELDAFRQRGQGHAVAVYRVGAEWRAGVLDADHRHEEVGEGEGRRWLYLTRTEGAWRDHYGELWHDGGPAFVPGPGEDVVWETL
ncbi:hypothetical protein [Deinococcus aquaedulcis]|uniref:hypothetical protein n=1 Tax=Deinococcus aquaedulcis TaxID=2840455 RepID=UPI001C836B84|nr:hypothetical protein [Deinococcus aquaedulcis]